MAKRKSEFADEVAGRVIKEMRIRKGLSQSNLAQAAGVSFQQIQKYELGKNRISISTMIALCYALEVKPKDFIREVCLEIERENHESF